MRNISTTRTTAGFFLLIALVCKGAVSADSATPTAAEKAERDSTKTNGASVQTSTVKNTPLANSNFPELDTLIQGLVDSKTGDAGTLPTDTFELVVVKKNAAVESVIQKYWGDLPFKSGNLKTVIFKFNPGLMKTAAAKTFSASGTLSIPAANTLRTALFSANNPPMAAQPAACEPEPQPRDVRSKTDETRGWIRFP